MRLKCLHHASGFVCRFVLLHTCFALLIYILMELFAQYAQHSGLSLCSIDILVVWLLYNIFLF